MPHQEVEGILSPIIRNIRLRRVAQHIRKESVVLDLACGAGYLSSFLPSHCTYYGVDRIARPHHDFFDDFLHLDLSTPGSFDTLRQWLPEKPTYITLVAFLEHIKGHASFLAQCKELLDQEGEIVGTTPHPRGRFLHDGLSKLYLCSRSGAEEHEDFLAREDLENIAHAIGGNLKKYRSFLLGLNQLFVVNFT